MQKKDKINGKPRDILDVRSRNTMDWGSFFESIHRDILNEIFDTNIEESSMALG